jgi:cobalt/nickel transport system permease protein
LSPREARRGRALLASWALLVFALSAVTDLRVLAGAGVAALLVLRRGALRALRRVALAVLPVAVGLSAASWAWLRLVADAPPPVGPFLSLSARTALIAFVTFSVLARVDLLRALAPFPVLGRLLVLTLAQIHALRLVATESALGLRSRLLRKPGTLDVVRSAGGVTAALFTLSARNARDVADAMRSRGFH